MGLVVLWHMGSSWIRDGTCVPCIGRWILKHCITREVLTYLKSKLINYNQLLQRGVHICSFITFSSVVMLEHLHFGICMTYYFFINEFYSSYLYHDLEYTLYTHQIKHTYLSYIWYIIYVIFNYICSLTMNFISRQ